jgi:hypothetical protein
MKKIFFSLFFIAAISPAFAQTVKYGISGGLNESILDYQNQTGDKNARLAGFHAGIFSDIDFGKVSIEPGLFYTTKGQKLTNIIYYVVPSTSPGGSFKGHGSDNYNYLELPVNILYNIPVSYGKFFIGGGPYLAYGLSAKVKTITTETQNNSTSTIETDLNAPFGNEQGDLKRFDFGLGPLGGLALKNGISLNVGYEHGLTNVFSGNSQSTKNDVITASLGYCFL